eukprot:CAMPEP_0119293326 /NCGR_PEP_ID=MMETSP1329-20130426/45852_1 /TAXON_ID=114041 /ORGANISM="Genus nov. species nov., Strain RCC1024" /LENGTH=70 /DNA_ID=CAMNT_0007294191 /DNA_START=98 /DNA_END=306 /DNA_ORIENTATION=-
MRAGLRHLSSAAMRAARRDAPGRGAQTEDLLTVFERTGSRAVRFDHATFERAGACEELTKLVRRWSGHRL